MAPICRAPAARAPAARAPAARAPAARAPAVLLVIFVVTCSGGCGSGSAGKAASPDTAPTTDTATAADTTTAPDTATDTPPAADTATATDTAPATDTPPAADTATATDTPPAADTTPDTTPDTATDTTPAPDTSPCLYVCNLDCECRKGPDGCDLPQCEPAGCAALAAKASAELTTAGAGCTSPTACQIFEFPICGSFGCFQGSVRAGADLQALDDATAAAQKGQCSSFHCGCGPPEGSPVCLGGSCRMCPPDCGDSCDDLMTAIEAFAAVGAKGCTQDADCKIATTAPCMAGPHIGCHGLAYRGNAQPTLALLDAFIDPARNCSYAVCDCQATEALCVEGLCVPKLQ